MDTTGRVIVLNGIGSVGKSSTAKALQKIAAEPLLHVPGDAFLEMMPEKLWGDRDWITFSQNEMSGRAEVEIRMGAGLERLMAGMRASVAALARTGNSCVVDDVMLSSRDQEGYRRAMEGRPIQFVGLHAPLDVLEQRERNRGDRIIGLARWQWDRVHIGIDYDFEINTVDKSPYEVAREIADALGLSVCAL
jgi:chloramphenicol 3-O phosphotransferase